MNDNRVRLATFFSGALPSVSDLSILPEASASRLSLLLHVGSQIR